MILGVRDLKSNHFMRKDGKLFIVDSEATFNPASVADKSHILTPSWGVKRDPIATKETVAKVAYLKDRDIDELLLPFIKITPKATEIRKHLIEIRNRMRNLLENWDKDEDPPL